MINHRRGYLQHSQNLPRKHPKRWKFRLVYWSKIAAIVGTIVSVIRLLLDLLK